MSRIGKRILTLPENVTLENNNNIITIKGPKGTLSTKINENITVEIKDQEIKLTCENDEYKKYYGTANANIKNMIIGVTEGYEKQLEAVGVGYRFTVKGKKLVVSAGYSHPVEVEIPEEITVENPSNTEITIKGIDKIKVGEFAANIRKIRKPEPYKGKGIRYKDEHIIRKVGKKAA